jgi:hypothetical protein
MTDVWGRSPYKGVELLIHLALADWANEAGECYPHLPTLISRARSSRTAVYRGLAKMKADGYLSYDGESLTKPSREIPFQLHRAWKLVPNRDGSVPTWDDGVPSWDDSADYTSSIGTVNEPSSNPPSSVTPVTARAEGDFEYWWSLYPKRVGKGSARGAYERALKKVDADRLVEAVQGYAALREGKEKQYTLNPTTWLNQERWEDDNLGNGGEWVDPLGIETPGAPDWYLAKKEKS